jgi:heme/copper-type cytochrome/quinol oxidase subunit 3
MLISTHGSHIFIYDIYIYVLYLYIFRLSNEDEALLDILANGIWWYDNM